MSGPTSGTNSAISNGTGVYTITPSQSNLGSISINTASTFSVPGANKLYGVVKQFAQTYTNQDGHQLRINGYEGGWSNDYTSGGVSQVDQLRTASKLVTSTPIKSTNGLEGWVGDNIANAKANSIEFPSMFMFTGKNTAINTWDALDDLYQPLPTPYWSGYANCAAAGNC